LHFIRNLKHFSAKVPIKKMKEHATALEKLFASHISEKAQASGIFN
jgi:hypothetical protein